MSKNSSQSRIIKLLIDIVLNPARYRFVINMPGRYDAAEFLFENHFDELPDEVIEKVESVLLASGKYKKVENQNENVVTD